MERQQVWLKVVKLLLMIYFGPSGVQLAAPSNKAVRLINGKTVHNHVGLRKGDSLKTYDLNLSRHKDRNKIQSALGKAGALIVDEFPSCSVCCFMRPLFEQPFAGPTNIT